MARPEIPSRILTIIDAAFGRARSKLQPNVIGYATRFAAVERLNAVLEAILIGEGEIPYLADLGLSFNDGPAAEMRIIVELLEAVQALTDWQINQPTLVDAYTVRDFFARVGVTSPWRAPAEIVFRDGNVSPTAQRLIRGMGRFRASTYGGQMVEITPLVGGTGTVITAISDNRRVDTWNCPPDIQFDANRRVWEVPGVRPSTAHIITLPAHE